MWKERKLPASNEYSGRLALLVQYMAGQPLGDDCSTFVSFAQIGSETAPVYASRTAAQPDFAGLPIEPTEMPSDRRQRFRVIEGGRA